LTYPDIEAGVREDNFSAYRGKTVKVNYTMKIIKFLDNLEAEVNLDLVVQITGATTKTEKRSEEFTLLWNYDETKWQIISF